MSKKIVIANWKMNPLVNKEAVKVFSVVAKAVGKVKNTDIVICPPYIFLKDVKNLSKKISLGAQDAFWNETGAFTGEVSSAMLSGAGVKYVILGHSERRALGENNADINKKVKASLAAGLKPILCVGEEVRDVEHGYFNLVKTQIEECLKSIQKDHMAKIIIAYEPVWALSTTKDRKDATAKDCEEMIIYIRKILSIIFSPAIAQKVKVIYGGSVNERDAAEFLVDGGAEGLLVGKASLDPKKFVGIINIAESIE